MITKNSIQHLLNHEGLRITAADVTDAAKEAGNIHNLSLFSEIIIGKILAATPMKRFVEPNELDGTLLFLCDEDYSGFITGTTIPIDGGFNAYSGV